MIRTKVITTIDFTAKTLTVVEGTSIQSREQLIFKIVDPTGRTIYINSGFNTSDFSSPDIEQGQSSELIVNLPTDSNNVILQGTYTLYYNSEVSGKYSTGTITLTYCLTEPTVDVSLEYSCRSSSITSTDNTDYDIYCPCSNSDVTPNVTRTHTVKYPTTMAVPIADRETPDAIITITPIWTKYWVSRVTSSLIYEMPNAAYTGNTIYRVTGTVTGIAEATVVCDSCLCLLYKCISSVISKWLSIKETASPADLEKYQTVLFELMVLHMQYSMSEGCETEADTRAICGRMQAILNAWDCECDVTANSAYSVEVVPVIGIGGGSVVIGGTTWYSATGAPAPTLGNLNDFYLNTTNGDIYKKTAGGWVLQFSMSITALVSNHLLGSDNMSSDSASNIYTELKSYEFDVADIQDNSVLVVSGNLRFGEPTGENTALRVNLVGTTTDSTIITVDANFGATFPVNIEIEYYIKDVTGTLTVVGKMYKLTTPSGIVLFDKSIISVPLQATLTPNEINFLVKSDDNFTSIYLDNTRINHLRTV